MKRLSNDMARRLNRLGCKSAELVEVTSWLINQGYFISVNISRVKDYIGDGNIHLVYFPSVMPTQSEGEDPLSSISPFMYVKDHYMEAVEMGLQWVLDNKIDPKTAEEDTAEDVTQEELQQA